MSLNQASPSLETCVSSEINLASLESLFGYVDSPGWSPIIGDRGGQQIFSRTRTPACLCWGSAQEVIAELGATRAILTGYHCPPGSASPMAAVADGHDLAIVDGRYLVDGWAAHVEQLTTRSVLDLLNPIDLAEAKRIHEPFDTWTTPPTNIAPSSEITAGHIVDAIHQIGGMTYEEAQAIMIRADEKMDGDYVLTTLAFQASLLNISFIENGRAASSAAREKWNLAHAVNHRSIRATGPQWDRVLACSRSEFRPGG